MIVKPIHFITIITLFLLTITLIGVKICTNDLTLGLSFGINVALVFAVIFKNLNRETISIGVNSISIFILLFFIIAPVMQVATYHTGSLMVNNLPFNSNTCIYANLQISLFLIVFLLSYFYTKKYKLAKSTADYPNRTKNLLAILSISIFIFSIRYVIRNMLKVDIENESMILGLILKKSLFMIPVAAFSLYFAKNKKPVLILVVLVFIILLLKNPISERRNAIGPLYLALLFFVVSPLYKTNFRSFITVFVIFFFLFPLSSILTNSNSPVFERIENTSTFLANNINFQYFQTYFNTLHYDAWSNICASIQYVDEIGYSYGMQFLGGIFFFIPRSIWPTKPIGSGHMLANDFLIPFHNLWLSNISCPIISEGYLNFGLIGIVFFAILLSIFVKKIDSWLNHKNQTYKIFAIYSSFWLFYLLRGDFMSSWAYLFGAYIGIILIPKFISNSFLISRQKQKNNPKN